MDAQTPQDLGEDIREVEMNLVSGADCLGLFVHRGKFHWLLGDPHHFQPNAAKEFEELIRMTKAGEFSDVTDAAPTEADYRAFRSGFAVLDDENFESFLALESTLRVTPEVARHLLLLGEAQNAAEKIERLERHLTFGERLNQADEEYLSNIRQKLPMFYVNFHLKEFFHMHGYVAYERSVSDGWKSARLNFLWAVPREQRWWIVTGKHW